MFDRLESLIGKNNLDKLYNIRILLIGVGGVGGTTLECLVRSNIGHITIVDGDVYELSNLNRQIGANLNNIGNSKVDEAIKRCKQINNNICINGYTEYINESNITKYTDYDYIIDACDDINAKVTLIKHAITNNIKIISSCGTGKRLDPSKVLISRLDKTYNDPLAKALRNRLKKEGISLKIPVVYSNELPINNDKKISSIITVPSTAGIYLASWIINDIIKNNNKQ